jgi:hypothetical protein
MNTAKTNRSMREHYYITMDTEEEAVQWMDAFLSHSDYSEYDPNVISNVNGMHTMSKLRKK